MYKLTVKNTQYTIPKSNLKWLAYTKALDLKVLPKLDTDKEVIEFLETLQIKVEELKK